MNNNAWARKYDAPEGTIWVCGACGKQATNKANGGKSYGWDESCFMNAVLCRWPKGEAWEAVERVD